MDRSGSSANLDFLRTCAVLMVTGAHVLIYLGNPVYARLFEPGLLGILGVALFFVHTSLVLMLSLERQELEFGNNKLIKVFYLRRAMRIYPLSIAVVTMIYLLGIPATRLEPNQLIWSDTSVLKYLANLLLLQNYLKNGEILDPLWSLPYEVQMYMVFPLLYWVARKLRAVEPMVILWAAVALAGVLFVPRIEKLNQALTFVQIPQFVKYVPCFLPGIIAYCYRPKQELKVSFLFLPLLIGGSMIAFMLSYDFIRSALICMVVGLALPHIREMRSAWLKKFSHLVAKYSYGIYLGHYLSIWFGFVILKEFPAPAQWMAFALSLAGFSVATYHLIERPFIRVGNRLAHALAANPGISYAGAQANR